MKVLTFDIGGTSIKYGVCINDILQMVHIIPTNAHKGGRHLMDTISSLIGLESDYEAIGISTAGQVNTKEGYITYANSNIPHYTGMLIKRELEEKFQVPVVVENDVNAAALGEAVYGAGKEYDNFLCLTYGTGIGGAIVFNKEIYHGVSFSAGEFGGIVTHGNEKKPGEDFFSGCYEQYASTTALVAAAHAYDSKYKNGKMIFEDMIAPRIREITDCWIDEIILGLITVIYIFNPSCIVLGGGIMIQPYILEEINRKIYERMMPSFRAVKIIAAKLENKAGLLGANYLVVSTYSKSHS